MVETGVLFLVSCFIILFCGYFGYLSWFDYPKFESKLIRWYRFWNGSVAKGGGLFGMLARQWIFHWSYKWFARLNLTFMFLLALLSTIISAGALTGLIK